MKMPPIVEAAECPSTATKEASDFGNAGAGEVVHVELFKVSHSCFEFFARTSFRQQKISAPSRPSSPLISFEAPARQMKNVFVLCNPARGAARADGNVLARVRKDRRNLSHGTQKIGVQSLRNLEREH